MYKLSNTLFIKFCRQQTEISFHVVSLFRNVARLAISWAQEKGESHSALGQDCTGGNRKCPLDIAEASAGLLHHCEDEHCHG